MTDGSIKGTPGRVRAAIDGLRGDGRGWIVVTVAAGWLVILGMRYVVPALLPHIKADFTIDNTTAGIAVTLIWITYGAMQFPAGVLIDRVGERRLLVASTVVGGAGVLLFAVVPVFSVFLVACALFGLGTGLFGPPRGTLLSDIYRDNDGAAFGVVLGAGSVGSALMPFIAVLIAERFGWRATFALSVPVFALIGIGLWWAIPRTRHRESDSSGLDLRRIIRISTRRPVPLAVAATTIMLFTFQGLTAFLPTYLVAEKGLAAPTAAALFTSLFLVGAVIQLFAGSAADRFGHPRVLAVIGALSVLPLLVLPVVDGILPLAVLALLMGVRMGNAPVANAYIIRTLPEEVTGATWGLLRTAFFAIGATGSVAVGVLADHGLFDQAFLALGALTAVAALLYLWLPPRASVTSG